MLTKKWVTYTHLSYINWFYTEECQLFKFHAMIYLNFILSISIQETVQEGTLSNWEDYTPGIIKIVMVSGVYLKVNRILTFKQKNDTFPRFNQMHLKWVKWANLWLKLGLLYLTQYLICINTQNHATVEICMFISIIFPNIARLYEKMEAWLPSWINANSTFVQYLPLCISYMLPQTPYANCMWDLNHLMFIF